MALGLFGKIYGNMVSLESLQDGSAPDSHGIRWRYEKDSLCSISYCLEFDGFCGDVIAFYQSVFGIEAVGITKYGDSPCGDAVSPKGADMVYSAVLQFKLHGKVHALKMRDSYEAARKGENGYDPGALLFYQGLYNPIFILRDMDKDFQSDVFSRLMDGGKINRQLGLDDKGIRYGSLIDKYGICWNLYSAV